MDFYNELTRLCLSNVEDDFHSYNKTLPTNKIFCAIQIYSLQLKILKLVYDINIFLEYFAIFINLSEAYWNVTMYSG